MALPTAHETARNLSGTLGVFDETHTLV